MEETKNSKTAIRPRKESQSRKKGGIGLRKFLVVIVVLAGYFSIWVPTTSVPSAIDHADNNNAAVVTNMTSIGPSQVLENAAQHKHNKKRFRRLFLAITSYRVIDMRTRNVIRKTYLEFGSKRFEQFIDWSPTI